MNLFKNKKVLIDLLKQGDVLNTINGGSIQPQIKVKKRNGAFTIDMVAPSMNADNFNILLDYHKLIISVHSRHPFRAANAQHPLFLRSFKIPSYIDSDGIKAHYMGDKLTVTLPFRKLSRDQRRRIRIEHL